MASLGAEVYTPDGSTLIATLTEATARRWLHHLGEIGNGRVRLAPEDPDVAAAGLDPDTGTPLALNYDNIVRMLLDGVARYSWFVDARDKAPAPAGEAADKWWELTGPGVLALLGNAIVYPEALLAQTDVRDRTFGWMASTFDDSGWSAAVRVQRQTAPGASPAVPAYVGYPAQWPDKNAYWIWSRAISGGAMPAGVSYFRYTFVLAADTLVRALAAFDNAGTVWLDNEVVIDNLDASQATSWRDPPLTADRLLKAGTHTIAIAGANLDYPGVGHGPAAILFTLMKLDDTHRLTSTVLVRSDNDWKAKDYPTTVPGMTAGAMIRVLVTEAQARGALPGISLGFTDALDSGGAAWSVIPDEAFSVGMKLLDAVRQLWEHSIDVEMTPALQLRAYNKGTQGSDLTATVSLRTGPATVTWRGAWQAGTVYVVNDGVWYAGVPYYAVAGSTGVTPDTHPASWTPVDWEDLNAQGTSHLTNALLCRLQSGALLERTDPVSLGTRVRKEDYAEIASAPSVDRALAVADAVFPEFGYPAVQLTGKAAIESGVYVDWVPGDTVNMPNLFDVLTPTTVVSVTVEEDDTGAPIITVEGMQDDA